METIKRPRLMPVLSWHGSKWRVADRIIEHFPRDYEGLAYVEVFGGTGALLATKLPSRQEVFNDLDDELMNFWRQLQYHPAELARLVRLIPYSKTLFDQWRKAISGQPTELLRAAVFCFVQKASVNGMASSFGRHRDEKPHSLIHIRRKITRLAARLRPVILENLPFDRLISFYDGPRTLFYCDPPYPGHAEYRVKFSQDDFNRLVAMVKKIKGKALISSALDQKRALRDFRLKQLHLDYTTIVGRRTGRVELLAMNW